jgi:hypothetical protein
MKSILGVINTFYTDISVITVSISFSASVAIALVLHALIYAFPNSVVILYNIPFA